MRRVGKTSLLREIERRAGDASVPFVPVVWDLQGSDAPDELDLGLHEALIDVEPALAEAGVELPKPGPAAATLGGLAASLRSHGRRLLLLCDEAEDLLALCGATRSCADRSRARGRRAARRRGLGLASPTPPRAARRAVFSRPSTARLGRPLGDGDARLLLRQENLPAGRRPEPADAGVGLPRPAAAGIRVPPPARRQARGRASATRGRRASGWPATRR